MRESYFSLKLFALRFCNIYVTAIFKKHPPHEYFASISSLVRQKVIFT